MDIHINTDEKFDISPLKLQKMAFVFNALENGWAIKKKNRTAKPEGWGPPYSFIWKILY